jgi:hypothetical protein
MYCCTRRLRERGVKDVCFELVRGISAPVFPQRMTATIRTLLMIKYPHRLPKIASLRSL